MQSVDLMLKIKVFGGMMQLGAIFKKLIKTRIF